MATYDELAERLAPDLAFLKVLDFINLRAVDGYVQVIQDPDQLHAELMVNRQLTDEERRWLAGDGWQAPEPPAQPLWLRQVPWPLTATTARGLALAVVNAVRHFISGDIAEIRYDARNYDTWELIDLRSLNPLTRVSLGS